ncbi:MAG: Type 1 glutamine amidotransferase-like domain-containing protein [Dehalococcoidia bacterium]
MEIPTLTRPHGAGWLVLIGGASGHWATTEPIDRAAVAAIRRNGPIAFLPAAGCEPAYGTSFLAHYKRLGAPEGYVVPIEDAAAARDPANAALLSHASLIYIGGGDTRQLLDIITGSLALEALAQAHEAGAVIAGASAGAIALADWGVPLDPNVIAFAGWGWIPDTIVSPHHSPERSARLRDAIAAHPQHTGLGLPDDVALALGPSGEAKQWGSGEIEIVTPR